MMDLEKKYLAEVNFFNELLVGLHTARWTGNNERFGKIIEIIGAYSYSLTNGNVWDEDDKCDRAFATLKESYYKLFK